MMSQIRAQIHSHLQAKYTPLSIVHFVTNRCNARCRHCFMDFTPDQASATELTLDEIRRLTRSLGKGLYNVNLTGGEPFIREDITDIVECYASETSAQSIVVTTNGWFTDAIRRCAERFSSRSAACQLTFSISLDDIGELHNAGRRLIGSYDRAMESYLMLRSMAASCIRATIALTVTPFNAARIEAIYSELRKAGVTSIFPVLMRAEGVQKNLTDHAALCRAYGRLSQLVDNCREENSAGMDIAEAAHRAKNRIVRRILGNAEEADRFHVPCTAGSFFATIMADGTVTPCELLASRFAPGNLRENNMDFSGIWNSERAEQARYFIRKSRCHCTFECAWTINVLAHPVYWPRLTLMTLRELV